MLGDAVSKALKHHEYKQAKRLERSSKERARKLLDEISPAKSMADLEKDIRLFKQRKKALTEWLSGLIDNADDEGEFRRQHIHATYEKLHEQLEHFETSLQPAGLHFHATTIWYHRLTNSYWRASYIYLKDDVMVTFSSPWQEVVEQVRQVSSWIPASEVGISALPGVRERRWQR